jgi:murein DD-endopeptidase MepM/ murein hydrolase activator NlpD
VGPGGDTHLEAAAPHPVTPPPDAAEAGAGLAAPAHVPAAVVAALRERRLTIPVQGVAADALVPSFAQPRGERVHEALDIMAAAGTPVVAVEDGTVAKLFTSKAGGFTVYQFDPSRSVAYYYAHLQRYASGLDEGATIRRGQVIGYVGATGNADPDAPHLHFAIFRLGPERRWWEGTAIDPYEVLR